MIRLPSYKPLVQNAVYGKDFRVKYEGNVFLMTKVIVVRRYNKPTAEKISEGLTRRYCKRSLIVPDSEPSMLELDDNETNEIVKDVMANLDEKYGTSQGPYVQIKLGWLPVETIAFHKDESINPNWYARALENLSVRSGKSLLGQHCEVRMIYFGNYDFPLEEIDFLLKSGVRRSDLIDVDTIRYDSNSLMGLIKF